MSSCCHEKQPEFSFKLGKKLKIVTLIFGVIFAASFLPFPFLHPLKHSLLEYGQKIWWPMVLGLFLGGMMDYFVPTGFVYQYLGQKRKQSLLYAVIAGFCFSACSHGMLAIAMQLYKKGASTASVITFLLASPWANFSMTLLMFSFFGWKAAMIVLSAMVIALITGFIYLFLETKGWIEGGVATEADEDYTWDRIKKFNFQEALKGVSSGSINLANMVLWWTLIGFLAAALISAYMPQHWFQEYLGPSLGGLLITLAAATVIEVCSEGTAPLAFEIFQKIGVLGNPFVFLMAGVITDYTEIGLIWSNIGKRAAILLPIITIPQVVLVGYLFNLYL